MTSSPVQRLINRRTKTLLPIATSSLQHKVTKNTKQYNKQRTDKKRYYDQQARDLPELKENQTVRIQPFTKAKEWQRATVTKQISNMSYEVKTSSGTTYRRNRIHLKPTKEPALKTVAAPEKDSTNKQQQQQQQQQQQKSYQTRSGRTIKRPSYLKD